MNFANPVDHVSVIEALVLNRASPAEIRGHTLAVREALEAYAALQAKHSELQKAHSQLKESTSKTIADLEEKNRQLYLRYLEAKSGKEDEPPGPSWPSSGLNHNF